MDPKTLEKYSSAITLADMEIFVFPELMFSLVLANIMSPILWTWRETPTFRKLEGKSPYRRLLRLKQFIMDRFDFNLDLETWGLTTQERELARFAPFVSPERIADSNALFGYQGDQYYFDVDIRRHFGLDQYAGNVIPYWKTETLEAMEAFALKEHYAKAAGECVSLAALYAAAAFVVCEIPLEDIFMILTPLHSQNFLDVQGGVLTNNRRLVTKAMWFNGTEITAKAQRALRNEQVTIVSHLSGYVHCLYEQATIDPAAYGHFQERLGAYLTERLDLTLFASFLRQHTQYQRYFQVCRDCHGQPRFVKAEVLFAYEHGSKFRVGDETFEKLLAEISDEDFAPFELPDRIRCDRLSGFLRKKRPDLRREGDRDLLMRLLTPVIPSAKTLVGDLTEFASLEPRLPGADKVFTGGTVLTLRPDMGREGIIATLAEHRADDPTADLAFYALRDMTACDWRPFVKAAVERSPVALDCAEALEAAEVVRWLEGLPDRSIYDGPRLAQPDEVVNFGRGDGWEKAFVLADVLRHRYPEAPVTLRAEGDRVMVEAEVSAAFTSGKGLRQCVRIEPSGRIHCAPS